MPSFAGSRYVLRGLPSNDCQALAQLLGNVAGFYDVRYNVGLNGAGRVVTWDDARGPGRGPQLLAGGTNLPTIAVAGVGISTDGVTTTGNFLRSPLGSAFTPSPAMTMIHIGGMAGANLGLMLSDNASQQFISLGAQSSTIRNAFSRDTIGDSVIVTSPTTGSATKRLSIAGVSSNPNLSPTQTSPYFFVEVGGRIRKLDTTGAWPSLIGTSYRLNIGINQAGNAWTAFDTRAIIMVAGDLSRTQILAIKAWADAYHTPTYDLRRGMHFVGDSLTFGVNASNQATKSYPAVVMAQTTPTDMTTLYDGVNLGVGGRTAFQTRTLLPFNVTPNLATFRAKDIVCLWVGTNDVAINGLPPTTVETPLTTMAATLKAAGAIVVGMPPIPREDTGVTSGQLANLKTLSDWFQTTGPSIFDVVVPLWNNPNFNTWTFGSSSAQNATIYGADKVHLTDAGYASIASDATNGVYQAMVAAGIL